MIDLRANQLCEDRSPGRQDCGLNGAESGGIAEKGVWAATTA